MALIIPPATNYPSPVTPIPDTWAHKPPEGAMQVACEILWGSMGGAGAQKCVTIDIRQNAPQNFTQIVALSVDNSQCGCDARFVFTDTGETVTIPAYSPKVIVPVFTRDCRCFVLNVGGVLANDVTRFIFHNTMPPPLAVPITQAQNVAAIAAIDIAHGASDVIVAAGINGTLENGLVSATSKAGGGSFFSTWELKDGTGALIACGSWAHSNTAAVDVPFTAISWQASNVHVRFQNGINLTQTVLSGAASANENFLNGNLYYRTP